MSGFRHVFDRHGVWDEARAAEPLNEFGPAASMGLLRFMSWGDGEAATVKREIRALTKNELRLFVAFAYQWGRTVEGYREILRWARGKRAEDALAARALPAPEGP